VPVSSTGTSPSKAEERSPAAKGWVRVVVQPWGDVWIDGNYMGRAPVDARLPKGRHVVEVGREIPSKTQVVRVDPDVPKEVVIDLSD
jgi:hypothetical protein